MAEDEAADDERVSTDTAQYFGMQLDVIVIAQHRRLDDKAADQEVDHTYQHANAEKIGQEAVQVAQRGVAQKSEAGDVGFENVNDMDQKVENEAPGDGKVKQ